jgi:WD40 repeat protein
VPSLRALLTAAHDSLVILTDLSALPCELVGAGGLGATAAAAAVAVRDETDAPALHTLRGHTKGVHALATLSVGGRHLGVSASLDRRVVLWQLETGEEVGALIGHRSHVVAVAADRAGERLVTLGADGELRIWELAGCTCAQVISPSAQDALRGAGALCYNAAHECIATGAHALTIWQPRKHTMPLDVFRATSLGPRGHKHPLVAIVHSPLFNLVLSADEAAVICLWELASGALLFRFEHAGGARLGCMAFDSTGRRLLTGAEDGCVRLYGFSSGELLRSHRTDGSASGASGRRAAHAHELTAVLHIADCGGQGETVAAVGGRQIWLWHQPQQPAQARDGADGQQPAAIGSAAAPKRLNGHRADILTLAFAPPVWLVGRARRAAPRRAAPRATQAEGFAAPRDAPRRTARHSSRRLRRAARRAAPHRARPATSAETVRRPATLRAAP